MKITMAMTQMKNATAVRVAMNIAMAMAQMRNESTTHLKHHHPTQEISGVPDADPKIEHICRRFPIHIDVDNAKEASKVKPKPHSPTLENKYNY
uniref:Uncharacterized protein n=1 Tax=Oryza nivara TaxID=4536 RepID=A0A0E0J5H1_ORYNI